MCRFQASLSTVFYLRSRHGAVGIATRYGLDDSGVSSSPGRIKNFQISTSSKPALAYAQLFIQWVSGAFSPGVKRPPRTFLIIKQDPLVGIIPWYENV
jgi:hypothetical protein